MYRITSRFGQQELLRHGHPHSGIDFAMNRGENIRSIRDGIVTIKDYGNVNAGKTVLVKWDDENKTAIYGHLNDFCVKNGQHVHTGDLLGHAGSTGFSTGNHLHFGLKIGGKVVDPSPYINDIQNMNVKTYVHHAPEITHAANVAQVKVNFFDYMNAHMNAINHSLSSLNLHFISMFTHLKLQLISCLSNDVFFIQISEQFFQFLTAHASLFNHIIACIF